MKKVLLAAAVASLGLSAAHAAPTLYGKFNVTLDQVDNNDFKGKDQTQLNSHASRIGVKGEEKITDNVGLIYQMEWTVATDGKGKDTDLSQRNRFVGLKFKDVGSLKVGKYDSYFKTAAGDSQDIFNDDVLLDITKTMYGEERTDNVVGFETDKNLLVPGLQFKVMAQMGEGSSSDYTTKENNGFGSGVSTALSYENKDVGLALALAGNFGIAGTYNAAGLGKIESDAVRLTGSLDLSKAGVDGLVLGALYQYAEPSNAPSKEYLVANKLTDINSLQENAWLVQATYKIPSTPWAVKGQYQAVTTEGLGDDRKTDQYGMVVDYSLNKQAKVYGHLAQQKRDWVKDDNKQTVVGAGLSYSF